MSAIIEKIESAARVREPLFTAEETAVPENGQERAGGVVLHIEEALVIARQRGRVAGADPDGTEIAVHVQNLDFLFL